MLTKITPDTKCNRFFWKRILKTILKNKEEHLPENAECGINKPMSNKHPV
jgi:hypothetical protein